jgi:hypothetical protein
MAADCGIGGAGVKDNGKLGTVGSGQGFHSRAAKPEPARFGAISERNRTGIFQIPARR